MSKRSFFSGGLLLSLCLLSAILLTVSAVGAAVDAEEGARRRPSGFLVKKEKRTTVASTEYGEISAARVTDNINGSYLLHFFTLDPNSLLLPLILHADMVFYVHTGSGKLSWTEEDELRTTDLRRGDVYRLEEGSVFFLQSDLETTKTERQKLRIYAIFADPNSGLHEPITGPYSSIRDMVLGFDRKVLQAAFNVPDEVIDEMLNGTKPPAIIHGVTKTKRSTPSPWEMEALYVRGLLHSRSYYNMFEPNKKRTKKGSAKLFNLFKESKDFENCNGWSTTVTRKKLSALKGSDIGLFMVNLTRGSMMGPHWNPTAAEVAVVLQGRGMVRVVCTSVSNETECKNKRFEVEEGDVFVVPKFHPMAQMAFNNETLVFMGFSSSAKRNHPQYLAGQASVFRTLDKDVLALSFNVSNATLEQIVGVQKESVILGCVSCAEEELRVLEKEEREREEEAKKKREEERKREEEEKRRREEEAAKEEEEERQRREEEEERKRQEEEARKREEEAARREEEERQRREEEEAAAKRREEEEEEERKRQEEEARRKEEEEAAAKRERAKRKEEEAAARREEEERQRREEEEEAEARREEEERRRREEKRKRHEEEEEAAKREEEERERREEEEAERKEEAAAARREEEERERRKEEEEAAAARREEEERERRRGEEAREREQERREEEEERKRHQEEEARRREEEQGEGQSEGERAAEEERRREEEAQREEQEQQREREERGEEEGGGGWGAVSF